MFLAHWASPCPTYRKSSAACNGLSAPRLEMLVFLYEKGKNNTKKPKNMLRGMRGCMSAVQSQEGDTLGQQSRGRAGRRTPPRSPGFLVVQHLIHATVVSCHHIPFYQVLVRFLQAVRSNRGRWQRRVGLTCNAALHGRGYNLELKKGDPDAGFASGQCAMTALVWHAA